MRYITICNAHIEVCCLALGICNNVNFTSRSEMNYNTTYLIHIAF